MSSLLQLEIDELKQQNEYLESEVCRYANAIEEEYVPVFIHEEYKREMKEMAEQLLKQSAVLQFATEEKKKTKVAMKKIMEYHAEGMVIMQEYVEANKKMIQEIEKLKEENEELKKGDDEDK